MTEEVTEDQNQDLKVRYDRLNFLWHQANQELRALQTPHESITKPTEKEWFGWVRCKFGAKQIAYSIDGMATWTPITECNIDVRMEMTKHYAILKNRVLADRDETISQLDDAIEELHSALGDY